MPSWWTVAVAWCPGRWHVLCQCWGRLPLALDRILLVFVVVVVVSRSLLPSFLAACRLCLCLCLRPPLVFSVSFVLPLPAFVSLSLSLNSFQDHTCTGSLLCLCSHLGRI